MQRLAIRKCSFLLAFGLASCSTGNPWQVEGLENGASTRLFSSQKNIHSPFVFEILRIQEELQAFLNLRQFCWVEDPDHPGMVKVTYLLPEERLEELLPLREGGMRIKLSSESLEKVISSLQEGKPVVILAEGFEETLHPQQFARTFRCMFVSSSFFKNLLQGPVL